MSSGCNKLTSFKRKLKVLYSLDLLDKICDSDDEDDSNVLDVAIQCLNQGLNTSNIPQDTDYSSYYGEQSPKRRNVDISNPMRGLKDAENPLESDTDIEFHAKYHFSKDTVQAVLHMILHGLEKFTNRGQPISPLMELLIALKFMVAGTFQSQTYEQISQTSVSRIVRRIALLLAGLKARFIKFPNKVAVQKLKNQFNYIGQFPDVVGCLGYTHVGVKRPNNAINDNYLNENGFYSLKVQFVCGPDLEFMDVLSQWPGATNENKIFSMSEVKTRFEYEEVVGVLLAENTYAPSSYVMTPIEDPHTIAEWRYNQAHFNTYNMQEAIDQLKKRFRCLQTVMNTREDTTQNIITSCVVLHNIARLRNDVLPEVEECVPFLVIKGKYKVRHKNSWNINEPLGVHRLMLSDGPRLQAYREAILQNAALFQGATVLDVGAGTGILSVFCAQAGAKKVLAVEASGLASLAEEVVKENKFEEIITVIHDRVENLTLDYFVDIIVSEWMGFYLLHEGMLDSVIAARDKFLKPGGALFPESATIYAAPCSLPSLFDFWKDVEGVSMQCVGIKYRAQVSQKPEVTTVKSEDLLAAPKALWWIDLRDADVEDLNEFSDEALVAASRDGPYQGICVWFVCHFPAPDDSLPSVELSTAPGQLQTHWKQTVIVLPEEQDKEQGEPIAWQLMMSRARQGERKYSLQLTMLDPDTTEHPMPCDCYMTKCIVTKAFLEEHRHETTTEDCKVEL